MNQRKSAVDKSGVTLRDLALVFARVGTFGFGGGMGMLAILREHVRNRKQWITEEELSTAIALGQMLPGPFIPNCVECIGYRLRGLKGMTVSALAFLLPSVVAILLLSIAYFRYGRIPAVQSVFRGVAPAVAAIMLLATWQMAASNCRTWRAALIALLAFLALLLKVDVLLTVAACGTLGILFFTRPRLGQLTGFAPWFFAPWFVPAALATDPNIGAGAVFRRGLELLGVFTKIGTIIWGGGFAAIPFIRQEVVDLRNWLTAREFIDGVALGQITPGPVAITATFVGYRVLGLAGAALATIGMFLPSFIILFIVLRVYDRIRDHYLVRGFLQGVLPAVVGMLLSATLLIGQEAITSLPAGALAATALAVLLLFKPDPVWLVLGGGVVGLVCGRWL